MTPEEVRAEAIDRIARFTNYHVAESAVEALGDLLPTGAATRTIVYDSDTEDTDCVVLRANGVMGEYADVAERWRDEGGRVVNQSRWTHDWQEVPE